MSIMKWTDTLDIAIALAEAHPDIDPAKVRFTDLMQWVLDLPGFDDDSVDTDFGFQADLQFVLALGQRSRARHQDRTATGPSGRRGPDRDSAASLAACASAWRR